MLLSSEKQNSDDGRVEVHRESVTQIAKARLTGEQLSVFLYLLGKLESDNSLIVPQKEMAQTLGMKQPSISKAMRTLTDRGIIFECSRSGLYKTYRLNPCIARKSVNRKKTVNESK